MRTARVMTVVDALELEPIDAACPVFLKGVQTRGGWRELLMWPDSRARTRRETECDMIFEPVRFEKDITRPA